MVKSISLNKEEHNILKSFSLLTNKPILYIANIDDHEISNDSWGKYSNMVKKFAIERNNNAIRLCGQIEMEISLIDIDEKEVFLNEYNMNEPGLNKLMIFTSTLINQIPIDETPTIATPVASIRFG